MYLFYDIYILFKAGQKCHLNPKINKYFKGLVINIEILYKDQQEKIKSSFIQICCFQNGHPVSELGRAPQ